MATATKASGWLALGLTLTPFEIVDRLKAYWTALGVTSALVATIGMQLFVAPTKEFSTVGDTWLSDAQKARFRVAHCIVCGISFLLAMGTVALVTMFYSQFNQLPHDKELVERFLLKFERFFSMATFSFQASLSLIMCDMILFAWFAYGIVAAATIGGVGVPLLSSGFGLYSWMQKTSLSMQSETDYRTTKAEERDMIKEREAKRQVVAYF